MKKIALATFYDDNFGTLLQAFALQHTIESMGYQIPIIRYHRALRMEEKQNIVQRALRYSPGIILKHLWNRKAISLRKRAFQDFRNKYLHFDNCMEFYRDSDLSQIPTAYDAMVCGSDMMWSAEFKLDWHYYMLGFMEKNHSIAYSPSFGKCSLTSREVALAKNYLNEIGYLSCREQKGVNLLKENFHLEALHTIDPTMLLDFEKWNQIIGNNSRLVANDYSLVYSFLGTSRLGRENVLKQVERINEDLVVLSGAEKKYKKNEYRGYAGPIEFLKLYRDSSFVVTDTFHGMLFAIIFQKPFVVLDKAPFGVSADRLVSTLETLGLQNRYITNDCIIDDELLHLDYTEVNKKISALREKSLSYLKTALYEVLGK